MNSRLISSIVIIIAAFLGITTNLDLIPRIWLPNVSNPVPRVTSCNTSSGTIALVNDPITYTDDFGNWHILGQLCNGTSSSYSSALIGLEFLDGSNQVVEPVEVVSAIYDAYTQRVRSNDLPASSASCFDAYLHVEPVKSTSYRVSYITTGVTGTVSQALSLSDVEFDPNTLTIVGRALNTTQSDVPTILIGHLINSQGETVGCKEAVFNRVQLSPGQSTSFRIKFARHSQLTEEIARSSTYSLTSDKFENLASPVPTSTPPPSVTIIFSGTFPSGTTGRSELLSNSIVIADVKVKGAPEFNEGDEYIDIRNNSDLQSVTMIHWKIRINNGASFFIPNEVSSASFSIPPQQGCRIYTGSVASQNTPPPYNWCGAQSLGSLASATGVYTNDHGTIEILDESGKTVASFTY